MIKIINEYLIRNEEQKEIVLDRLYNDPKLRRYGDFIDYFIDFVDSRSEIKDYADEDVDVWFNGFYYYCNQCINDPYRIAELIGDNADEIMEMLEINPDEENAYKKMKLKISKLLIYMSDILRQDKTLMNDLFYSASGTEADVKDSDWGNVEDLVQQIIRYTNGYEAIFSEKDANLIKKHMKKTSQTLYRIEPFSRYTPYMKVKNGEQDTIYWDDKRTKGIKSFTEDPDCYAMGGMKISRSTDADDCELIIYETVGDVYSFNIDQLSNYAQDINTLEYEHLVSGEFEVVDVTEDINKYKEWNYDFDTYIDDEGEFSGDILWVKIKQIHK